MSKAIVVMFDSLNRGHPPPYGGMPGGETVERDLGTRLYDLEKDPGQSTIRRSSRG